MAKKKIQPYWRPNYRIQGTLPDIKVVRTDFIINSIAVACALFACFYLFQREYRAHVLRSTVAELESQVQSAKPKNKVYLAADGRFRAAAEYIVELEKFYDSPYRPLEVLVELSGSVPSGLIFNQLSLSQTLIPINKKSSVLGYTVGISGDVSDLPILDSYKMKLQDVDFLAPIGYAADISETVSAPDQQTRIFPYRLTIQVQPEKEKKGKK